MGRAIILFAIFAMSGCASTRILVNGDTEGTSYILSGGTIYHCQAAQNGSISCAVVDP